ncbi:CAAX amino terminal protease [Raphidocelis subcapitata]|uniref:CAAX amino terminal protease n=1 Tax=Raphidocelis subcapitata TaxID=307507 RepID=A0A2V0NZJ2_9CHLO|nr:CAAX amino terminal protease [Raphidocelis subcapitata]|eukprot:GBF93044.1 CAAX amino terminal protease [Raphidocelis subcapitata]
MALMAAAQHRAALAPPPLPHAAWGAAARLAAPRPPCSRRRTGRLACRAERRPQQEQQQQQQRRGWRAPPKGSSASSSAPAGPGDAWAPFDPKAYDQPWSVPWGLGTVAGTMAAWAAAFVATAFIAAPALYTAATGARVWDLGPAQQADFALWSEVLELGVTAGLLWFVTSRHPKEDLESQRLFNFSPANPFAPGRGWLAWGLAGVAAAPLVVGAAAVALSAVGYEDAVAGGRGTVDGVAAMLTVDLPTYARLIAVTGILAPLLEETLFRGFLLTSLSSYMSTPAAIFASSLAFGVAHLSLRDLPVLVALGCLLGALYVRSRNLLTPMLVHGAWNSGVLTLLFALAAAGVDVQQLLKEGGL